MKAHLAKVSLALLSVAFLLGCQEQGSEPVGPDGQDPEFTHKNEKPHGGGGGGGKGALHPATGSLADAMVTTSAMLLEGKQIDLRADDKSNFVQTIRMNFQSAHALAGIRACRVVVGEGGKTDAEIIEEIYWELLQAQLTTTVTRGSFFMNVDTTGLAVGGTTTTAKHWFNVKFERPPDGFLTGIWFGFLAGNATVTWISSENSVDVFEFSGPVMVSAKRVDGGKSRKSERVMACDGTDKVTVTVDWSPDS